MTTSIKLGMALTAILAAACTAEIGTDSDPSTIGSDDISQSESRPLYFGASTSLAIASGGWAHLRFTADKDVPVTIVVDSLAPTGDMMCNGQPAVVIHDPLGSPITNVLVEGSMNPCDVIVTIPRTPMRGTYALFVQNQPSREWYVRNNNGPMTVSLDCGAEGACQPLCDGDRLGCPAGSACADAVPDGAIDPGVASCLPVIHDKSGRLVRWTSTGGAVNEVAQTRALEAGHAAAYYFRALDGSTPYVSVRVEPASDYPTAGGFIAASCPGDTEADVEIRNVYGHDVTALFTRETSPTDPCRIGLYLACSGASCGLPAGDYDVIVHDKYYRARTVEVSLACGWRWPGKCGAFAGSRTRPVESCVGTPEETWRCTDSLLWSVPSSQVCRGGMWLDYNLEPKDCSACSGSYSDACAAPSSR